MASNAGWNKHVPSGTSLKRDFPSDWTNAKFVLENSLNEEHYLTSTSSASAGIHRLGSARVHVGSALNLSSKSDTGRLLWQNNIGNNFYYVGSDASVQLSPDEQAIMESAIESGSDNVKWVVSAATGANDDTFSLGQTFLGIPSVRISAQTSVNTSLRYAITSLTSSNIAITTFTAAGGALISGSVIFHVMSTGTVAV